MVNCKNVCREIEEANHGEALTASTMEHLAGCGNCHRFYDERRKLRQLVASLEPVEAPADFDMQVRSRLASSQNGARAGSLFANFSLGWPTLALAGLVLVIGVTLAFKVLNSPGNNSVAVQDESKPAVQSPKEAPVSVGNELVTNAGPRAVEHEAGGSTQRPKQPKKRSQLSSVASLRNGRRLATQEFSSSATPVVKKEEAIASNESSPVFQIEASPQPLRLSLDYSSGVSRTISVPSLSFGSERVLTGNGSLVKSSSKGSW